MTIHRKSPLPRQPLDGRTLLAKVMRRRRLNQLNVEALTGIPQSCISRYLAGHTRPGTHAALRMQEVFRIPARAWLERRKGERRRS